MIKVSNNPLISVIVPIYDVEEYLAKCVESIVNQTYKNLEIILVDDGSPDNCPKMCDEYALKDSRIKVIHKENGGLSDARNTGLKVAKGKFVTFVDSDDSLSKGFIEYLYNLNVKNNTMISVAPYVIVTDKKKINCGDKKCSSILNQKEALERMLLDKGFTVSSCSKLYDMKLFDDVEYPKNKVFEDTATTYKLFLKCDSISYGYIGGYYYYKRGNSIINSKYNKKQLLFIELTDQMGNEILNKHSNLYNAVESKKIDARFSLLRRIIMVDELDSQDLKIKNDIVEYILSRKKEIIFGKYNIKVKIATIILSVSEKAFKLFWIIYSKFKYEI